MKFSAMLVAAVAMEVATAQYQQPRRLRAVQSRGLEGHTDGGWGGSAGGSMPHSAKASKPEESTVASAKAEKS